MRYPRSVFFTGLIILTLLVGVFHPALANSHCIVEPQDLPCNSVVLFKVIANAPGRTSETEIPNESITLLNNTDATISLAGLTISDEQGSWEIGISSPSVTLKSGETWTVTGAVYNPLKDCFEHICLRNSGECLWISYRGRQIDKWCYPKSQMQGEVLIRSTLPSPVNVAGDGEPLVDNLEITFWGAAGEVQGSCYQVSIDDLDILVDCGSFMDLSIHKDTDFQFTPSEIDAVLITHAHDDHIGRLHHLFHQGFEGPVYMTEVTEEIYMLKLDEIVNYWAVSGDEEIRKAIERSIIQVEYLQEVPIEEGVTATFVDTGHIPGSASVVLKLTTDGSDHTLVFSGDIGPGEHPFLNPPDLQELGSIDADLLVVESTYGNVRRDAASKGLQKFSNTMRSAHKEGDLVVIPSFSLDRTQRIIAAIGETINQYPLLQDLDVAVGGKSSCLLTQLYLKFQKDQQRYDNYFKEQFWSETPLLPVFWEYIRGTECSCWKCESEDYIDFADFKSDYDVIVTPSGFGTSSLSKKLIEAFVDDEDITFIRVGWAPEDSPVVQLGKRRKNTTSLADKYFDISSAFSGHADQTGLLEYLKALGSVQRIAITHGDQEGAEGLSAAIQMSIPDILEENVKIPVFGEQIVIFNNPR